ncbi:MAG TPA: hypothetical protein VM870_01640, partial [Pyrinomonadaceae bacterium]|nr:hypothetical protein [Pyrinomonadaceae bacterium]
EGAAPEAGAEEMTVAPGSYLIFLTQPFRADVQALFERQRYPDRRTTPGGDAERPYDVAGWTLPLQMGLESYAVKTIREPVPPRRFVPVRDENEVRRALNLRPRVHPDRSPVAPPFRQTARLAIYRGWTDSRDEGWTRYVFDSFNVRYDSLRDREVRRGDLRAKYDVIVLPSQSEREMAAGIAANSAPAEYTGGMTEAGVANLRQFVEAGGTLICFDEATELAINRFALPLRNDLAALKPAEFYCPGSILRLDVETTHPLARGLGADVNAYFIHSRAFAVLDDARARVVARYADRDLLQSGWLLGAEHLRGKPALIEAPLGQGRVILFGFRPQHRGQTWATYPFIFNAVEGDFGRDKVL